MRLKGFFLLFTLVLTAVCIYQLSFTWVASGVERKAEKEAILKVQALRKQAKDNNGIAILPNSTTVECTVLLDITPVIIITSLGCDSATYSPDSPPFYTGTPLNQTVTIIYTASQFGSYAGETFTSTNYPGLTVTLDPETVTSSGSFTGTLGGIPTVAGTAYLS